MNVDELIRRTCVGKREDAYWLALEKDILAFLGGAAPKAEKERFRREGRGESVYMLCEAIRETNRTAGK